ncbi:MAG: porin family protein, partial [Vibrio sp.]
PLEFYAKGGVQSWVREGFDDTRIEDDDDLDSFWGIGANYSFMGPISVGLEYSHYKIGNDAASMLNATATISLF